MSEFHNVFPPGGWTYREEKTNTKLIGSTRKELISNMLNHRRINGIQAGDPEGDLMVQIAKNYPDFKP